MSDFCKALEEIYEDVSIAKVILANDMSPSNVDDYDIPDLSGASLKVKLTTLQKKLEDMVIGLAEEKVEFDCEFETERVRNTTSGLLIAMREIRFHFLD